MTDPNRTVFIGRFACDAIKVRENFAIAHIIVNRDVGGEERSSRFTLFINNRDRLVPHLKRGRKVYVESEATETREYRDAKGVLHPSSVAFIVQNITFLDSSKEAQQNG